LTSLAEILDFPELMLVSHPVGEAPCGRSSG
jgi:hypothetical protein